MQRIEVHKPPARQRIVQLLDAVPLMAGGLDAGGFGLFDWFRPAASFGGGCGSSSGECAQAWATSPGLRPECADQNTANRRQETPGVRHWRRCRIKHALVPSYARWLWVERESTKRAQHLEIGDQRVHLCHAAWVAIEVTGPGPWGSVAAVPSISASYGWPA